MLFSISILLVFVSRTLQQTTISPLAASYAYRIGQKSLLTSDLATNGTYLVNFDMQYPSSTELMPPLLAIPNMDFLNTASNQIFFSIDPYNFNSNDNIKFSFQVKLGPVNTYYTKIRVKYLVSTTNDNVLLPIYIYTNQKTLIQNDAVNLVKVYQQQLFYNEPCIPIPILGCVLSLLNNITSTLGLPLTGGLGGSLNNNSASPYTVIQVKTFITKLDLTYNGPWSFSAQSSSTNISDLNFQVKMSNSITGTPKYNFSVLIRNTSYSLATASYKFYSAIFNTVSDSSWSKQQNLVSYYLLLGFTSVAMTSANTNKKINFLLQPTTSELLLYTTNIASNTHNFPLFAFMFIKCTNTSYQNLMFDKQECYSTCPTTYYSNITKFCVKCVTPCKTCNTATYCITCLPQLRLVPSSGSCIPCSSGYYFHDTLLTCQLCPTGCTGCDNLTYCTNCSVPMKLVLSSNQCISCLSTQYFKYNSGLGTSTCELCPTGCTTCDSSTYCTNCSVHMKLVLSSNQCVACLSSQYFEYDSGSGASTCKPCPTGCTSCDNSTYCTNCSVPMKLILSAHQCVSCLSTQYFKYDSGSGISSCELCPVGCKTCLSSTSCLSCYVSMKLVLVGSSCLSCATSEYFLYDSVSDTSSCQNCPIGCTTCDNSTYCLTCSVPMELVLVNNQCVQCSTYKYFYYDAVLQTSSCQNCPHGCSTCDNSSHCFTCNSSLEYYYQNNYCYPCNYVSKYFNPSTQKCEVCSEGCLHCNSVSNCSECNWNLQYQMRQSQCYQCIPPTIFTRAMKCQYLYQQEVTLSQEISILRICSKFNISEHDTTNTQKLIQDYYISLFIDNRQKEYFNLTIDSREKLICFDYQIVSSFTNQQIDVIYHNKTNTDRIINPQFVNQVNGSKIYTFQKDIYDFLQNVMDVMSSGSGVSAPILFLSSGISFLMGFIQFAEITSLYIYTQAPVPYNFKKFLQTIVEAQNFPLLPFTIPNPIQNYQLEVVEKEAYSEYDFDQYFIRGNFIAIMEILTYLSLYLLLCWIFHFIKSKNLFARFFYKQFVARCYSNCALALEVVQIILLFSASVAVSSRGYLNAKLIMNSVTGLFFTLVLLGCAIVNIVYLYKFKTVRTVDTQQIYPALERNRKGAEMYTFLRTLCLLSVALLIPLIHYVYIVLMVICLLTAQLWYLFKKNVHKFRIQNWIRILHTFLFMLFNVLFLIYFIIDRYFPSTNTDIVLRIGNVSMISLLAIYSCDLLFAIIDIGDKIYQKLANVLCKKKVIEDKIQERNAMLNKVPQEKQITIGQETQDKTHVDSAKIMLKRARRINKPLQRQKVQFKKMKRFSKQSKINHLDLSDFNTKPNSNSPLNNRESQMTIQDPYSRQAAIKSQKSRHRQHISSRKKRTSLVDRRKQGEVIKQQINLQSEDIIFPTTDRKQRTVRSRMFKNISM